MSGKMGVQNENERETINIHKFVEFMKTVRFNKDRATEETKQTHTLMENLHENLCPFKGTFSITSTKYNEFLDLYNAVLKDKKMPLYFVERPIETGKMVGPLVIDIDYNIKSDEREYDITLIKRLIEICNKYFAQYLNIKKDDIIAYVKEKSEPTFNEVKNEYKDGFHIFYDIPFSYNKRKFLFDLIKKDITENDLFENIDTTSDYDSIVDEHVLIDNGVLMYGSTKKGRLPYELTHVFNFDLEEFPLNDFLENDNLVHVFSMRKYSDDDEIEFKEEYSELEEELRNKDYKAEKKQKAINAQKTKNNSVSGGIAKSSVIDITKLSEDHLLIYEYVNILSVKRAQNYETWVRVCWALNNISPQLYGVFIHFSKKAPNFNETSCFEFWEKSNRSKSGLTIASLKMWAREDNPKEYEEIRNRRIMKMFEKIREPNDNDTAEFIKELYGEDYKCVSISKNIWYEFQNHRWVTIDSGYTLLERISNDVAAKYLSCFKIASSETNKNNGIKRDDSIKNLQTLLHTVTKLKEHRTATTLVKTCARKMYDNKFEETLDANPYLIGFDNGVFDLQTMKFRDGVPDDRLTMNVGYSYKDSKPKREIIEKIEDLIEKIQPENDMREYIYRFFSSCLDGKNRDQSFRIFTGTGGNGKSVIVKLFELAFGEYYGVLPAAVLTMKDSGPNNASPFLAVTRGKRAVAIHETEGDASIQLGKMKGITGGDKITTRKLFGDPFDFTPQFKLFLICNKLPKIPSDDGGTWRRIKVTPFESKFVTADKVNPAKHHYLRDNSLDDEKLGELSQAFMWMLINIYYPKYIKSGLCEPDKVAIFSEKYKKDSDILFEYLSDSCNKTKDEKDTTKTQELFRLFKEWHKHNYNTKFEYAKKDIEEYLMEKYELVVKGGLVYGLKFNLELNTEN